MTFNLLDFSRILSHLLASCRATKSYSSASSSIVFLTFVAHIFRPSSLGLPQLLPNSRSSSLPGRLCPLAISSFVSSSL